MPDFGSNNAPEAWHEDRTAAVANSDSVERLGEATVRFRFA